MAGGKFGMDDWLGAGKQFWDSWTAFAQGTVPGQTPSWSAPADVFAQMAGGLPGEARHAIESLGEQGQQFLRFMQEAASRLGAGEELAAGDVAGLWKRLMADGHPLLDAMQAASSEGARGFEQMGRDLQAWLAPLRGEGMRWLQMPAFGYTREKQEALQALFGDAQAHAEAMQHYQALLAKAGQRGNEYFENKLAERSEPGRQIDSMRALYDLWVDAQEDAYAEIALSPEFRSAYAALVNTQMRLRRGLQHQVESQAAGLGLPTRSELDGTHAKVHQLQRELRELRTRIAALEAAASVPAAATAKQQERPPAAKPARSKAAPRVKPPLADQTDVAAAKPRPSNRARKGER